MGIASESKGLSCLFKCIVFEYHFSTYERKRYHFKGTSNYVPRARSQVKDIGDTKVKGPDPLNKKLKWRTYASTLSIINSNYYTGIDHDDLNKGCPHYYQDRVYIWVALCNQVVEVPGFLVTPSYGVVILTGAHGDNGGDDRQEQGGGSEEDKPGEAVVAVTLAIDAYPNYESSQNGTSELQCVHKPYLHSHALVE